MSLFEFRLSLFLQSSESACIMLYIYMNYIWIMYCDKFSRVQTIQCPTNWRRVLDNYCSGVRGDFVARWRRGGGEGIDCYLCVSCCSMSVHLKRITNRADRSLHREETVQRETMGDGRHRGRGRSREKIARSIKPTRFERSTLTRGSHDFGLCVYKKNTLVVNHIILYVIVFNNNNDIATTFTWNTNGYFFIFFSGDRPETTAANGRTDTRNASACPEQKSSSSRKLN